MSLLFHTMLSNQHMGRDSAPRVMVQTCVAGRVHTQPSVLFTLPLQREEEAAAGNFFFLSAPEGQTRTKPVFTFPVFPQVICCRPMPRQPPGRWMWVDLEGFHQAHADRGGLPSMSLCTRPAPINESQGVGSCLTAPRGLY